MDALGVIAATIATISWSIAPITIRLGIKNNVNLALVAGIRAFIASITLLPIALLFSNNHHVYFYDLLLIIVSGTVVGLSDLLYIESIKRLGSWRAILISYQYILIAQILAYLALKEVRGIYAMFFTPLASLGLYIALKDSKHSTSITLSNFMMAYVPAVLWGIATVISKYLTGSVDLLMIAMYRSMVIALIFTLLGIRNLRELRNIGAEGFLYIAMSGIFTHVSGFSIFLYALKSIGTFISTLINSLGPLITQIISNKLCNEEVSRRHVFGALITTSSIVLTLIIDLMVCI